MAGDSSSHVPGIRRGETLSWLKQTVPPGEHVVAPAKGCIICFLLGSPFLLEQTRDGRTGREMAARGTMQVISSDESRIFRHHRLAHNMHVFLPPTLMQEADTNGGRIVPRVSFRDTRLEHLLLALQSAGDAPADTTFNALFRDSIGLAIIAALQDTPPETASGEVLTPLRRQRVLEIIHDRIGENLSLAELSAAAGLRPTQFTAQFRATFGMPPHRFLLEQRVRKAIDLLQQRDQSPAKVAAALGFYDQSHLTRHMRRLLGVTPGQIVRQQK